MTRYGGADALATIRSRRSSARLRPPGPSDAELRELLSLATYAPDHGRLRPWQYVVIQHSARRSFAEALRREQAAASVDEHLRASYAKTADRVETAPAVIVAATQPRPSKTVPDAEQAAAVAASVQNILIGATAMGYGSMWRTGPVAYEDATRRLLGFPDGSSILAFVYLGTPVVTPEPHQAPSLDGVVRWLA